jgi:hypothetical protein
MSPPPKELYRKWLFLTVLGNGPFSLSGGASSLPS